MNINHIGYNIKTFLKQENLYEKDLCLFFN